MATPLENVLENLLVPDNAIIQQATLALKSALKEPSIVVSLCEVVSSSTNRPQLRQYAAVLLRRRIYKKKQWKTLPLGFKQHLRENVLQVMIQEQEKSVRNSVVQIVACVAKHELASEQGWAELFSFLDQYTNSIDPQQREVGMSVLSTVAAVANEQLKSHLLSLCSLFDRALQDAQNFMVQYYAIITMTHMICQVGTDEQARFQGLVPHVLASIRGMVSQDEDKACESLEIFDELVEADVSVILPHIKPIVEFCLEVSANNNLSDTIRVKAMCFISWLTRLKHKSIIKHKLVNPIIDVMFTVMCVEHDENEEEEEEEEEGAEASSPHACAGQVIDTMALHLPPEKIIPKLMSLIEPALASQNPHNKKAAYLAMAVVVEGCSEAIRNKYMSVLLHCVGQGVQDQNHIIRNAALFALAQFSEHLQPDISKYAHELIPLLLGYLRQGSQAPPTPGAYSALTKTYHALESFCEGMGKDIVPFLPSLIEQFLSGLNGGASVRVRELSISGIAAVANAAKKDLVPYFQSIVEPLKTYLTVDCAEEVLVLQIEAFDTLAVIARVIGSEHFLPLTPDCLNLGTQVMQSTNDPDLRRCIYGLMAAISTLLKENMEQYLPPIVAQMLESVKSTEGITLHFNDEDENGFKLFDEEDIENDDGDDDDDYDDEIHGVSVENAYLEEKKDACYSLGEIAINTGHAFMPYIEQCYQEVEKLDEDGASIVRQGSVTACAQFCCCLAIAASNGVQEAQPAFTKMLSGVLPRLLTTVREDVDRDVVTETLEAIKLILDKVQAPVLTNPDYLPAISGCVKCVMAQKTACQDTDEDVELDGNQSEYDHVMLECAGEIIPSLIKASDRETALPFVGDILPELVKKLKKGTGVSERSFAIGTIAEIIAALEQTSIVFVDVLYPVILQSVQDEDEEVRSNAVYACGELARNGGDKILPHYPEILSLLSATLAKESYNRAIDNICGAVCRMILTSPQTLPVDQVFPVVLQNLPLKEDFDENETVFECIRVLYEAGYQQVVDNLSRILLLVADIIGTDQTNEDTQAIIVPFVKLVGATHPDALSTVLTQCTDQQRLNLQSCMSV